MKYFDLCERNPIGGPNCSKHPMSSCEPHHFLSPTGCSPPSELAIAPPEQHAIPHSPTALVFLACARPASTRTSTATATPNLTLLDGALFSAKKHNGICDCLPIQSSNLTQTVQADFSSRSLLFVPVRESDFTVLYADQYLRSRRQSPISPRFDTAA